MTSTSSHWQGLIQEHLKSAPRPLIVLLGPTASGKTALSLSIVDFIAQELHRETEIVNADSRQLYRSLSIGTAKITDAEKGNVPHHLIDVLQPNEELTAASYKKMAEEVINQIHARGNIPILVGGSMLYISALIDNLSFAPVSDPELRNTLEKEYDADSGKTLFAELELEDPETASQIHQANKPYVLRALEILRSSGKPSSYKESLDSPYDLLILGIDTDRAVLHERINARVKAMLDAGWMEEVKHLLENGYTEKDPAMKSHGYKEIIHYLQKGEPENIEKLTELIAAKGRQYAKRQLTWWRGDERINWIYPF